MHNCLFFLLFDACGTINYYTYDLLILIYTAIIENIVHKRHKS
jgi:hypothetical protein